MVYLKLKQLDRKKYTKQKVYLESFVNFKFLFSGAPNKTQQNPQTNDQKSNSKSIFVCFRFDFNFINNV